MALQIAPFIAVGPTSPIVFGSTTTTFTFGVGTTGLPLTAARIYNAGTAGAGPVFVQFISSNNTTTVGITNSQPILSGTIVVLGTGGQPCLAGRYGSTFTGTVFATGGFGYAGA